MIITKTALPRRTFIRGAGITLSLPFLDAMVPAMSAAAEPPLRTGFFYLANGCTMVDFHIAGNGLGTPNGVRPITEMSKILKPLEPFKNYVVEVSGLANNEVHENGAGPHTRAHAVWIAGVKPKRTEGVDIRLTTTLDQHMAQRWGKDTPLESLQIALEPSYLVGNCDNGYSCAYMSTFSWKNPTTPLPMENQPRIVFERLFGDGTSRDVRLKQLGTDKSLLDSVRSEIATFKRLLGPNDRQMVTEYLDSIRDVEGRLGRIEKQVANSPEADLAKPMGIPADEEYFNLMIEMTYLAYRADITRSVAFQLSRETSARTYPQVGVNQGHHDVSHHQSRPERMDLNSRINAYQVSLFAKLLEKLHNTPDVQGSMLDNSLFMIGSGMGDGDQHSPHDLPVVAVGGARGKMKGGRTIKVTHDTPMMNFGLALLDKADVHYEKLGDSTGRLTDL